MTLRTGGGLLTLRWWFVDFEVVVCGQIIHQIIRKGAKNMLESAASMSTLAQNNTIVSAELEPLRGHKTSLKHKIQ